MKIPAALAPLALLALSCGSSGSDDPAPDVDVAGSWVGRWESREIAAGGQAILILNQSGRDVRGTADLDGFPGWTGGTVHGAVSGSRVAGLLIPVGIPLEFELWLDGDRLSGGFEEAAPSGISGTLSLDRL